LDLSRVAKRVNARKKKPDALLQPERGGDRGALKKKGMVSRLTEEASREKTSKRELGNRREGGIHEGKRLSKGNNNGKRGETGQRNCRSDRS